MKNLEVPVVLDKCHMTIRLPQFFEGRSVSRSRKLFNWMFQAAWQNEETIKIISDYLPEMSNELKDLWDDAGSTFQNEYQDPNRLYYIDDDRRKVRYTKAELVSIKAKNKRMLDDVKAAKFHYETFQKVIAIWNETKAKYGY